VLQKIDPREGWIATRCSIGILFGLGLAGVTALDLLAGILGLGDRLGVAWRGGG